MEQSISEMCAPEQIIMSLEDEKAQLEERLNTEMEDSERQKIEDRIGNIHADLEIKRVMLKEPSSEPELRRSERERRPTEKMLELIKGRDSK